MTLQSFSKTETIIYKNVSNCSMTMTLGRVIKQPSLRHRKGRGRYCPKYWMFLQVSTWPDFLSLLTQIFWHLARKPLEYNLCLCLILVRLCLINGHLGVRQPRWVFWLCHYWLSDFEQSYSQSLCLSFLASKMEIIEGYTLWSWG